MTDTEQAALAEVEARLCLWRIFEIDADYHGRPKDGTSDREFSTTIKPGSIDTVRVTVGTFPQRIREAIREVRARGPYALNEMFIGDYKDLSIEEREAVLASLYEDTSLDDLNISDRLYLTVEVARPQPLTINTSYRFLWAYGAPDQLDSQLFEDFASDAGPMLTSAIAWLLPGLYKKLPVRRLTFKDDRPFLLVPDRAAVRLPHFTTGDALAGIVITKRWEDQPWEEIGSILAEFNSRQNDVEALILTPGRWLGLALAEEDILRKFLFAYCGLEVLANKFLRRSRTKLTSILQGSLPGIPIGELLWPKVPDENAPQRNLVFSFATLATLVHPETAEEDTTVFQRIAKARNNLAHGNPDSIGDLPALEAVTLLTRYLRAVVVT